MERDLPLCVWVSEDATAIIRKLEYNPISNKIVGFALPFQNGVTNVNAYLATTANIIAQHFQNNSKATYAYVIVVKSLIENVPSLCPTLFGTNNK